MVKFYDSVSDHLRDWAMDQPLFYVASAPLTGKHVNVSPKGLTGATFTVTSPNSAMYIDSTGSGSETIAHLYENKRITVMFCSFDTAPRILRFFCWGTVVERDDPAFEGLLHKLGHESKAALPGARAVIKLDIFKVSTSCGFGVPMLDVEAGRQHQQSQQQQQSANQQEEEEEADTKKSKGKIRSADWLKDRDIVMHWAEKMNSSGKLEPYQKQNNTWSLDGCTGLRTARKANGQWLWVLDGAVWARRVVLGEWEAVLLGMLLGVLFMIAARSLGVLAV